MADILTLSDCCNKPDGDEGCWLWPHAKNNYGYGVARLGGRARLVHRASWECANGPIPQAMCVLHKCDTPACINPAHLFIGTRADNNADKVAKGRQLRGERQGGAILTESQARYILASKKSQRALAREFGISSSHVSKMKAGGCWRHIQ